MSTANEAAIERAYEAFGTGDMEAIRNESFAPGIKWTWPGTGGLSGIYDGIDAVLGMFGQIVAGSEGTFKVAPESIAECGDFVVVRSIARWTNTSGSHTDPYVQVFRMGDGRATECHIHLNNEKTWDNLAAEPVAQPA